MKGKGLFISKIKSFLILSLAIIFLTQGCGGGGSSPSGVASASSSPGSAQAFIGLTDAPGDFLRYAVNVTAIKLHRVDGAVVDAIPPTGTTTVDFTQLTSMTEFLTAGTVGVGTYDKVTLTLDYSNADIEVYDTNNNVVQIPVANITDESGNPITSTIDLTVKLCFPLTVTVGGPVHLALDFNLGATNLVTFSGDTPSLVVSPYLEADMVPDVNKIQQFRGALQSVNVGGNSFVMILRPFMNAISNDASFGTVTVLVNSSTVYNIDGTNYTGSAGLTALNGEPAYTAVVAHGTFDANLNFTAIEVLAGSSVPGGTLDAAVGTVLSRSSNTLTLRGATLTRSTGVISFNPTITVTLASTTEVSEQFSSSNLTISNISVGQRIGVLGTYSSGTTTMDATNGYVRMYLTSILGLLNYPASASEQANGWLSMTLQRIDGITIVNATTPFNFAGTGTSSQYDASITDYSIKPAQGLDTSSLTTNGMPLRMIGFVNSFGSAPEDFDAQTIVNLSNARAFLNVGWGSNGQSEGSVFSATTSTSVTLSDSTMASVGYFHRVNRGGDITDFVTSDISPVVQADGLSTDRFVIYQGGTFTVYSTWTGFINALNSACTSGALIQHLYGWGTYSDSTTTFSASFLLMVIT